ncbi:MAG: hypothetical protein ACD_56C00091G0006 [uncultured bacterium]|nr:MAG: hypothetical protein ACD_56C00091G0006 [uncultured bacterium]
MKGLGEGKSGRFAVGASNNRGQFFDKLSKNKHATEIIEDDEVEIGVNVEKKTETKHESHETVETLKKKAKKILNVAVADELKKKMEQENVLNVHNKSPLNSEIFFIASLVGKNILEDDFILVDIMETLRKGEEVVLDQAYKRQIEAMIQGLSKDDLNKLIFKFFVFKRVDAEIDALKKEVALESIYQSSVRSITPATKFELTDIVMDNLRKMSDVESDFLNNREHQSDFFLKEEFQNEISVLIHNEVRENLIIDEVPIALNIGNSKVDSEQKEENNNNEDDMQEKIEVDEKMAVSDVETVSTEKDGGMEMLSVEHAEQEEIESLLHECQKLGEIFSDKMMEYQSHAVTDEDRLDVENAREKIFNPILKKYKDLVELNKNADGNRKELKILLKNNKASIASSIDLLEDLIRVEEEKYVSKKVAEDSAFDQPEKIVPNFEHGTELIAGMEIEIADMFAEAAKSFVEKFRNALDGNEEYELLNNDEKEDQISLSTKVQIRKMLARKRDELVADHGLEQANEKELESYILKKIFQ